MRTVKLTTKSMQRAIQFYQQHLSADVCSYSLTKTTLLIPEHQLQLELHAPDGMTETHYAELKIQLTSGLLDKISQQPEIFYRPFLSVRAAGRHQLPVELQDPDGHRWTLHYSAR